LGLVSWASKMFVEDEVCFSHCKTAFFMLLRTFDLSLGFNTPASVMLNYGMDTFSTA